MSQLDACPPASLSAVLHAHCRDGELDAALLPAPGGKAKAGKAAPNARGCPLDMYGVAAVACLTQMAVTANNDAMWKPLHHQVRAWVEVGGDQWRRG